MSIGDVIDHFGPDLYNEAAALSRRHPPSAVEDPDGAKAYVVELYVSGSADVVVLARSPEEAEEAVMDDAERFLDPEYSASTRETDDRPRFAVDDKRGLVPAGDADDEESTEQALAEAQTATAVERMAAMIDDQVAHWSALPGGQPLRRAVQGVEMALERATQVKHGGT